MNFRKLILALIIPASVQMGNLHLSWTQRRFFKIYLSDIHADHSIRDYSRGEGRGGGGKKRNVDL